MYLLNMTTDSYQKGKERHQYIGIYRREEVIEIIKQRYAEKQQDNLPIFGIDKSNLNDFTTTEKDMKRMTSRYPPP